MKKKYILILLFVTLLNYKSLAQNMLTPPLYRGKTDYTEFVKYVLNKIVYFEATLDSSKNRSEFTFFSFDVSVNGTIENITFSRNYPQYLIDSISKTIYLTSKNWQPASINNTPIKKKIMQPIYYQKGSAVLDIYSLDRIFNNKKEGNNEIYMDVIILPIYVFESVN